MQMKNMPTRPIGNSGTQLSNNFDKVEIPFREERSVTGFATSIYAITSLFSDKLAPYRNKDVLGGFWRISQS